MFWKNKISELLKKLSLQSHHDPPNMPPVGKQQWKCQLFWFLHVKITRDIQTGCIYLHNTRRCCEI